MDVLAPDLHVEGFRPQPGAAARVAGGLARVAAEHVLVLDLVALAFHPLEEGIDSVEEFRAVPEHLLLLFAQLYIGLVDGEVALVGVHHHLVVELFHQLAPPRRHGALVDAQRGVGNDERLVDADGLAVAPAYRACAQRAVVAEQVLRRLLEADAVGFEQVREVARAGRFFPHAEVAAALRKGGLGGVEHAADRVLVAAGREAVDQQEPFVPEVADVLQRLFHLGDPARSRGQAREALLLEVQEFLDLAFLLPADVREDEHGRPGFQPRDVIRDAFGGVAADFAARDGRIGLADAGEEQAQVVVDLGGRADGRARVARVDLLFDGDGGRQAGDQVDVGLAHPAEELAREGRKALREAPLPFGEQRVEGQRTLAAARDAGDDHQFPERNVEADVLQVVNPGAAYVYLFFLHLSSWVSRLLQSSGRDSSRAGVRRWGSSRGGS